MQPCPGCGARVPVIEGPTHRYMASSPGCWAWYGEVLAREYQDSAYFEIHRLTVDAYAVQHPGTSSPQSIRSAALHLMRLCLTFERGLAPEDAVAAMQRLAADRRRHAWLEPPASRGAVTVADVRQASGPSAHKVRVQAWAKSAWTAWALHHETVRNWLEYGLESRNP